ncbi:MAG: FHA domain-containing protein [Myxococcales bacterium]|nr:FHA domain-containing protein [Myxococcales bacterium]MDH3482580.1 FHA domain-containing protein [Myxococcales bacterium]
MGVRIAVQSLWAKEEPSTFVYEFAQSRIVIGRSRSADVQLPHLAVSATHATIRTEDIGYILIDEGSTNGTRVNETPVVAGRPKPLRMQDTIDIGGYQLTIDVGVPVAQTISARLTTEYARKMLAEQDTDGQRSVEAQLEAIQSGADQSVQLLPIPKTSPSNPPPRTSAPPPAQPTQERSRMSTSELVVYSLAGLLLAASVAVMVFLMR